MTQNKQNVNLKTKRRIRVAIAFSGLVIGLLLTIMMFQSILYFFDGNLKLIEFTYLIWMVVFGMGFAFIATHCKFWTKEERHK